MAVRSKERGERRGRGERREDRRVADEAGIRNERERAPAKKDRHNLDSAPVKPVSVATAIETVARPFSLALTLPSSAFHSEALRGGSPPWSQYPVMVRYARIHSRRVVDK